jgi:ketosteroid isomerase-like protein
MRKAADTLRMGALLLGAVGLGVLVGGGTSYAADVDDVKAAVAGYHAAISSLDLAKIDAVWAHDGTVIDKEPPDRTITVGWEGTRKKFEGMIAGAAEVSIAQVEGPHIQVQGDLAWSAGMVKADGKTKAGERQSGVILEADVFKKQDGRWLLVSHITSVMPQ